MTLIAVFVAGGCQPASTADSDAEGLAAPPSWSPADKVWQPPRANEQAPAGISESVALDNDNPFAALGLPEFDEPTTSMIRFPLRVQNAAPNAIVVTATAGAASVVLDTIDSGSELRIDLKAPSEGVVVKWRAIDGTGSGDLPIAAVADSVQIVRIGEPREPR